MDKRKMDHSVVGLSSSLRSLQWDRQPEVALRACVANVLDLAGDAPPELRGYLVDRLDPVLAHYGIDAARLMLERPG